ncbi:hypothetical protein EMIT093MI4_10703 [Pseudomonas sp. IT-93MI4]
MRASVFGSVAAPAKTLTQDKKNVGAGLLAKVVFQSTFTVTDTPLSRASPLPHWVLRLPEGQACFLRIQYR